MSEYLEFAVDTARKAGAVLLQGRKSDLKVEWKGRVNAVTDVDKRSEDLIKRAIERNFPDHGILAEESDLKHQEAEYRWIIDPLDGTTNFLHGYPVFCVSIALVRGTEIELGVIFDPVRDELFHAVRGGGAYLNGVPISVSGVEDLNRSILATGFPYEHTALFHQNFKIFKDLYMQTMGIRRLGAAALDLAWTAAGRLDGYWEYTLNSWDIAAGALLVTEAGGRISLCSGEDLDLYAGNILATNGRLHDKVAGFLITGDE